MTKNVKPIGGMVWEVCVKCGMSQGHSDEYSSVLTLDELIEELKIQPEADDKCSRCGGALTVNHSFSGVHTRA